MKKINFFMVLAILKLGSKTIPQKIQYCKNIVTKMTGNPDFATPDPALIDVANAIKALELAYENALKGGTDLKTIMYAAEKALDDLMKTLRDYVQLTSKGDPVKIMGSGMDIKSSPTPVGILAPPSKVLAEPGKGDGEILAQWSAVKKRKNYNVYLAA